MQGILHIVHTLWTCARISFNFLRKTYTFCMEGLYIFHGTAAHILWKNYTFSTETLPIFYRTVIHFVRKSCIFSTENPVHIRFYGSVMHLLRNSYTFSKEVLHIFYGTRVSLTGPRTLCTVMSQVRYLHITQSGISQERSKITNFCKRSYQPILRYTLK